MDDRYTVNILEDMKGVLSSNKNINLHYIGLFYYIKLIEQKNIDYNKLKKTYKSNIECVLQLDYGLNVRANICEMNYEKKELLIDIHIDDIVSRVTIVLGERERLYARWENSSLGNEIISMMEHNIGKLYNDMLSYESFIVSKNNGINIENTNFYVDVEYNRVLIYYGSDKEHSEFVVEIDSSFNVNYLKYNDEIKMQFSEIEDNILKEMEIEIKLLPEWSQSYLYNLKANQVLALETRRKEELKAQKRAEFLNKITSVFKKR